MDHQLADFGSYQSLYCKWIPVLHSFDDNGHINTLNFVRDSVKYISLLER